MRLKALTLAALLAASMPAVAEKTVYACQYVRSGGLNWNNGQWQPIEFNTRAPFFFSANNNALIRETVAKVLKIRVQTGVFCRPTDEFSQFQTCSDYLGGVFSFSFASLNGAIAQTFGGTQGENEQKDSLVVSAFNCTKM